MGNKAMRSHRAGNDRQREAERVQESRFSRLMSYSTRSEAVESPPVFRVGLFFLLRDRQPDVAWQLGYMAGWPEMRR